MKTRRIARSDGRTRSKSAWANERNFQANLEKYESDILDQTLSQFYAFRNSEILPSWAISATSENTRDIHP